jgi:hypothetical protein
MAAFDYPKTRATAERLIDRFGQDAQIIRLAAAGSGGNPGTATRTPHACRAVVTRYSAYERANTEIEANDRKVLVSTAGLAIVPAVKDKLAVGGETFEIVNVATLSPGGTTLLWTLQARI